MEGKKSPRATREGGVATIRKTRKRGVGRYRVLLHNDDFTSMEFVVSVLIRYFAKDETEAVRIMLNVHHQGVGVCGRYTREIAETKVAQVGAHAQDAGMPLQCSMEPE